MVYYLNLYLIGDYVTCWKCIRLVSSKSTNLTVLAGWSFQASATIAFALKETRHIVTQLAAIMFTLLTFVNIYKDTIYGN